MNTAIHTTLALVLLIFTGMLLKRKVSGADQLKGIKVLVLSIALPAMIFVSLLKINIEPSLLLLPILALAFNLVLFFSTRFVLPALHIGAESSTGRTLMMLLPSMAPGLSCFPFLLEYWGEETVARAALADVGNKFFGLILLYMVAMHWYYQHHRHTMDKAESKLKSLFLSLIREPINLVLITALLMLGVGLSFDSLPLFLQESIMRMRSLMTPLVLLYIGLAVRVTWKSFRLIGTLLFWRAGLTFLLSAGLITLFSISDPGLLILAVAFPQSATSFWPFAHMSAVQAMEQKSAGTPDLPSNRSTFDLELGLQVLACSLPFSTCIILAICSSGSFFTAPVTLVWTGALFLLLAGLPLLYRRLNSFVQETKPAKFSRPPVRLPLTDKSASR